MRNQIINQELVTAYKIFPEQSFCGTVYYMVAAVTPEGEYDYCVSANHISHDAAQCALNRILKGEQK